MREVYLSKGATKTEACQKCRVDKKTIVDTSVVAELKACDIKSTPKLHAVSKREEDVWLCRALLTVVYAGTSDHSHRGKKEKWRASRHFTHTNYNIMLPVAVCSYMCWMCSQFILTIYTLSIVSLFIHHGFLNVMIDVWHQKCRMWIGFITVP